LEGKGCGTPSYFCASILTNEELIEFLRHPATVFTVAYKRPDLLNDVLSADNHETMQFR